MPVHGDERRGVEGVSVGQERAVVVIRPAEERDLDALHRVDRRVFGKLAYPYFALRQLMDVHSRHCVVADDGRRLLGYCLGALAIRPEVGWVLGLGVLPEVRGAGYGRELVAEATRRIVADGAREVRLFVDPDNDVAIHIYERLGFRVCGFRPHYFGPEAHRLVMTTGPRSRAT
jgi:[ribosomal protein S18]-alanine N-acetyltransferase